MTQPRVTPRGLWSATLEGLRAVVDGLRGRRIAEQRPPALASSSPTFERLSDGHAQAYARLITLATGRPATQEEVTVALASRERTEGLLEVARARDLSPTEYDDTRRVELLELLRGPGPLRAGIVKGALARVEVGRGGRH